MITRRLRRLSFLALGGVALAGAALALQRTEPAAVANTPAALPPVEIAIVATPHDADARTTDVRLVAIDPSGTREQTLATLPHAPGAVVRGDLVRGRGRAPDAPDAPDAPAVVVVADEEVARERDWGSALWLVDAKGARILARGAYHASRPLGSTDGYIYVQRGASSAWPPPAEAKLGKLRTDALRIDAIDPATGASHVVYSWSGYTLHIAGEWRDELVVYRVSFDGADLVAIDRASGRARLVSAVVPFARDFSVDAARGAIWMSNRDDKDASAWIVARIDLASGKVTRLATERGESLAPFAMPDGTAAWTASGRRGLVVAGALDPKGSALRPLAPLGAGYDTVTGVSGGAVWATVTHVPSGGGYDQTAAVHVASGTPVRLTTRDERVTVLGFVDGANGGAR